MRPIAILGSGLAGYALLREIRKLDRDVPVALLSADDARFYSKPNLSAALSAGKTPESLSGSPPEKMASDLRASILPNVRVERVDLASKTLFWEGGSLAYSQLALALGADPAPHGLSGPGADRIFSVNSLEDYRRFRQALRPLERVAILGGGLIGCEFANDLAAAGHPVSVVHRGPWPLERLAPEPVGRALAEALADRGVSWLFGRSARSLAESSAPVALALDDGSVLEADIALCAIGLRARVALASSAGLAVSRGILADAFGRTSDPSVFALGDCAEIDGALLPYVQPLMIQAKAIAATLLGNPSPIAYPPMPVQVKTPALPLSLLPPPPGSAGGWRLDCSAGGICALHLGSEGALLGFALSGERAKERSRLAAALGSPA